VLIVDNSSIQVSQGIVVYIYITITFIAKIIPLKLEKE